MIDMDVTTISAVSAHVAQPNSSSASRPELHRTFRDALIAEHLPVGFAESLVINDIARRAAQLELLDSSFRALESQVARALDLIRLGDDESEDGVPEMNLAAIAASDKLQSLLQLSFGCSRTLYRALDQLSEIQRERRQAVSEFGENDTRFLTEVQCLTYLVRRFQTGQQPCPRCGQARGGAWIAARRCWQCNDCETQSGVRTATVMYRSPLPLTKWFAAIRILLFQPTVGTVELGTRIGIRRVATVRLMSRKICAAMGSNNSSQLAGLDRVFLA